MLCTLTYSPLGLRRTRKIAIEILNVGRSTLAIAGVTWQKEWNHVEHLQQLQE
jgi:hypothetical protein